MPSADDVYLHCDDLENIPTLCRENWEYEITLLSKKLQQNAKVLQVGCMDGTRIIALLTVRPDLTMSGLDIEQSMVDRCNANLLKFGKSATVILGDITKPVPVTGCDSVLCLNNTLGYIKDQQIALKNMQDLGKRVFVSVFGEAFNDDIAREYFSSIGLSIRSIRGDEFAMEDFGTVLRYSQSAVEQWGGETTKTPLGYFCEIGT